jgi:glycerol-3-phosphate dehydrogenase (NAD(P)+)
MKVAVIGAGNWGTALAKLLAEKDYAVTLWAHEPEVVEGIRVRRQNPSYLQGVQLPETLSATLDMAEAVAGRELVLFVAPSHVMRRVMQSAAPHLAPGALVASAAKGIENETLLTMSGVAAQVFPPAVAGRLVAVSGPSFAREVALKMPTAISAASRDQTAAEAVQQALATDYLRVYTTNDVIGVELGGAVKNVIAIAAGISDGMGFGTNSRAALITRGLVEIARLGVKLGANPMTFAGLAGLGDLVLTCTGDLSRNRQVGLALGRGKKLKDILAEMTMVAEGVKNAEAVYQLSQKMQVEMPITEQVYLILYADKAPAVALATLMGRKLKSETIS